jgi:hypothetical protein
MAYEKTNRRDFVKTGGAVLVATTLGRRVPGHAGTVSSDAGAMVAPVRDQVIVYPAPEGEILSTDYTVEVNGRLVPVYAIQSRWHDKKYSAAYFDFSGSVAVKIKPNLSSIQTHPSLDRLAVLPSKYGIRPTVVDGEATFTTDRPFNISFEPTGQYSPLHLFGNPLEVDPPKQGDRNVIYFGPGIHKPTRIDLTAGQTLYIAGGAVVKAAVTSVGDNIRIMGRGILDGNDWPHFQGPANRMVWPADGRNIVIQDIIIRGSWTWTVAPTRCDEVLISNLKICGSRCGNDDGIDPCNSSNVTIRNCFIHTDDDGIAVKGTAEGNQDPKASENIVVEDCTFAIDFANGFRIGAESRAIGCRNFTARNIDFIHFPDRPQVYVFYLHPGDNLPMENLVFEDIRINGDSAVNLARLTPMRSTPPKKNPPPEKMAPTSNSSAVPEDRSHWDIPGTGPYKVVPGAGPYIHNVVFKNVAISGQNTSGRPLPSVYLQGLTDAHDVRAISFDNVTLYSQPLTREYPGVRIGNFVSQIQFSAAAETTTPV